MRKLALAICALGLAFPLCGSVWASGNSGDSPAPAEKDKTAATAPAQPAETAQPAAAAATPALAAELAELRALLKSQAAEIEAERRELAELKAKLGDVKEEAVNAAVSAAVPAATAAVEMPKNLLTGGDPDQKESPLAIHFKGITLTPGGFTAAETVFRNRALSADINTAFTAIPFAANNQSKITEFNATGRQSRFNLKMDGDIGSAKIGGFFEGDFLGAGSTSNNYETNSYVFRQRQFYGYAKLSSGWFFGGGQMWSLVTEQKEGLDARTRSGAENANVPMSIDPQYVVGFSWARQYGFRVADTFYDNKLSLAVSVEGSETRFSTGTGNTAGALPDFILQATGAQAGTFNPVSAVNAAQAVSSQNYSLNATPDFVVKAAIDPGWGHYEIFGAARTFRSRIFPCGGGLTAAQAALIAAAACPTPLPNNALAHNDTRAGGFAGVNLRAPFFNKHLDIGVHALYGDGVGRYGTTNLQDTTVRATGTLAPIRGGQALGTIEWHVFPKLDVYMYGGGEYDARTIFPVSTTLSGTGFIGYGVPTINDSGCAGTGAATGLENSPTAGGFPSGAPNCAGSIRNILEGTLGFWHKIYQGDRGRVQWGLQYSYVQLNAWSGSTGSATPGAQYHPTANDSMFFTSFRYYLP